MTDKIKITNLNTYEEYKDSDNIWIPNIPKNTKIVKAKNIGDIFTGLTYNPVNLVDETHKTGILVLRAANIQNGKISYLNNKYINMKIHSKKMVKEGDLLICGTNGSRHLVGKSAIISKQEEGMTFGGFMMLLRQNTLEPKYLYYIMNSHFFKSQIELSASTSTIYQLTKSNFDNMFFLKIDKKTQKAIATFLDKKTFLIDSKISILKERKQLILELEKSLINQVVTKGLESFNLDMNGEKIDFNNEKKLSKEEFEIYMNKCGYKDSDIEWIGYIPKSWNITNIKKLFILSRGRVIAKTELDKKGLYPVYSSQTKKKGIMGYINTCDYKNQDLLTWTTDGANAGKVFKRSGNFNCTNVCGTLIKKKELNYQYYSYLLDYLTEFYKRPDINGAKIMNNEMAIIPLLEMNIVIQNKIVSFLDKKISEFQLKVSNIDKEIELLEEYKKTVINDVVTGKIKVIK
jgi:type I restriction enzyme S subunit